MIEIQIAGAGAGKTYGLAKSIVEHVSKNTEHKKTFALTYTNTATSKIEEEVINQLGHIPKNLFIQTVHSFLLNEIIYPFSSFTLGDIYSDASITPITDPKYKQWTFKRLKEKNVIHTENVYKIAKQVIDETVSKHGNKIKKQKVKRLQSIISCCIDKIFIDEVQDLDNDALRVFEVLGINNIEIYMIGDPKQAIKYPEVLDTFLNNALDKDYIKLHDINNVTRRVPSEILVQSNRFCYDDQQQTSSSHVAGKLRYIESTHERYIDLLNGYIKSKQIVCIDKKTSKYSTSKNIKHSFHHDIEELIKKSNHRKNEALILKSAISDFIHDLSTHGEYRAKQNLISRFSLNLEPKHFAQLKQLSVAANSNDGLITVSSIDSVKGLDSDVCVIILTPNILKYLLMTKLKEENKFNKEWKKIYVALTRPKKELILALDHELLIKHNIEAIKIQLEQHDFKSID